MLFNFCWKSKIIHKNKYFPIFRDFSPISVRFAPNRCFLQSLMLNSFDMSYKTYNDTWCLNFASFRTITIEGMWFSNFPRFYFNFTYVLPQNVVVRNLCQRKYLIGQTRHDTVHTAFFNIRWKRKIIQKIWFSHFPWFFANFCTFYPKTWLFAIPNEIHFWYVLQSIEQYMMHQLCII